MSPMYPQLPSAAAAAICDGRHPQCGTSRAPLSPQSLAISRNLSSLCGACVPACQPPSRGAVWVDVAIDFIFIGDIGMNFRSAYLTETGELVLDTRTIAYKYLSGWFVIDFSSSIPIDLILFIVEEASGRYTRYTWHTRYAPHTRYTRYTRYALHIRYTRYTHYTSSRRAAGAARAALRSSWRSYSKV